MCHAGCDPSEISKRIAGAPKTIGREGSSLGRDPQMDGRRKIFGWTYQWRRFWRRWRTVILLVMLAVLLGIWLALLQSR
jgi:hypothetical protein